jgi:hypothetical protein
MMFAENGAREWHDNREEMTAWVDITRLEWRIEPTMSWLIEVAEKPTMAAELHPDRVLTYGLVMDTTRDGIADYEIGINNDTPNAGDFRVWLTDLNSGTISEKVGPGYGIPLDFSHPDESGSGDDPSSATTVRLFFLEWPSGRTYRPPDLDSGARYYAWSSLIDAGEVVASDYAPDVGWLER